jgi:hypothetical protein
MLPAIQGQMRVLIFAAGSAVCLVIALVYVPPLLRPGVPVRRFRQLPRAVADDLNSRGCNVVRGNNVISGDFYATGRRDWAVLCQRDNQASLFIYRDGGSEPAIFNTHGSGLSEDPESARGIRSVRWDYVARHNPGIRPGLNQGVCVEDGVGMGSSIYCYLDGAWVPLAGAD